MNSKVFLSTTRGPGITRWQPPKPSCAGDVAPNVLHFFWRDDKLFAR